MMNDSLSWLWAAVGSSLLLGLYDVAKKRALKFNGVLEVLMLSTLISTLFFVPLILSSFCGWGLCGGTLLEMPSGNVREHLVVALKSVLVSLSWILGLFGLKHLPITIAGLIKSSRPVFVILGCILLFHEKLNVYQWIGVVVVILSLYLLGRSSRREGIDFIRNRWVFCMAGSVLFGVLSALLDKYIMKGMSPVFVQGWCNLYIAAIMTLTVILNRSLSKSAVKQPLRADWTILLIAVFITLSDFLYFYSLSCGGSLLSVISMLRRGSVIVTFVFGALLFKEKNLKAKAFVMLLMLAGMVLLLLGS